MNKNLKNTSIATRLIALVYFFAMFSESIQARDATITIHLRGVHESKISLLPLTGVNALKPIAIVDSVKNGETTTLQVSKDNLPGEFVLRFDYKGKQSLGDNYFDGMDLSEPLILKTANMKEWMDGYVNLYGELSTNIILRDSLFTNAGNTAIEKARTGHPMVYGWMVDYFFTGYESFNIEEIIAMPESAEQLDELLSL